MGSKIRKGLGTNRKCPDFESFSTMIEFPTIGKYNKAIQNGGSSVFQTLSNLEIIPSRTAPIKVYLFGSGAYAAVFQGKQYNNKYALRCFLNSEPKLQEVRNDNKLSSEHQRKLDNAMRIPG